MAMIETSSDLIETRMTPQETNTAMQLMNRDLSYAYLQNTRVNIVRTLAAQDFTDPADDAKEQRARAYMKGQLDLLATLLDGILNPTPVPLEQVPSDNQQ